MSFSLLSRPTASEFKGYLDSTATGAVPVIEENVVYMTLSDGSVHIWTRAQSCADLYAQSELDSRGKSNPAFRAWVALHKSAQVEVVGTLPENTAVVLSPLLTRAASRYDLLRSLTSMFQDPTCLNPAWVIIPYTCIDDDSVPCTSPRSGWSVYNLRKRRCSVNSVYDPDRSVKSTFDESDVVDDIILCPEGDISPTDLAMESDLMWRVVMWSHDHGPNCLPQDPLPLARHVIVSRRQTWAGWVTSPGLAVVVSLSSMMLASLCAVVSFGEIVPIITGLRCLRTPTNTSLADTSGGLTLCKGSLCSGASAPAPSASPSQYTWAWSEEYWLQHSGGQYGHGCLPFRSPVLARYRYGIDLCQGTKTARSPMLMSPSTPSKQPSILDTRTPLCKQARSPYQLGTTPSTDVNVRSDRSIDVGVNLSPSSSRTPTVHKDYSNKEKIANQRRALMADLWG